MMTTATGRSGPNGHVLEVAGAEGMLRAEAEVRGRSQSTGTGVDFCVHASASMRMLACLGVSGRVAFWSVHASPQSMACISRCRRVGARSRTWWCTVDGRGESDGMERACHATAWPCLGRGDQGAVMPRQGEASGVQREAVEVRVDLVHSPKSSMGFIPTLPARCSTKWPKENNFQILK